MATRPERIREQCDAMLMGMLGDKDLAEKWWHGENKGFNGQKPIDVDINKVKEYLLRHVFGEW